ncbi:lysosomal proton-coupled steroid conjugate and bile acid symporter SLC46A3-like [Ruditapes philippinarum]|uniref:lysosomal proton-coupled steroid conjugate and bile acid symporter SLC46A3-like n=1 Tax=Ruditapes philippinarum TaxID=129788 RepID=UPI00295BCED1|nr:lysosomal proton-coupled steroid conjugate and bile acid symporter SLC46A3-like [Ruditapes philippinarum]
MSGDDDFQDSFRSDQPGHVQCDYDTVSIPGSILEQKVRIHDRRSIDTPVGGSYYESSLPNLAESVNSNSVYLVKYEPSFSARKWLVGPYCFLYMAAYITSYFTFIQYVYAKIQKDLFPDVTSFNVSGTCNSNLSSEDYKKQTLVQQHAANWTMYYSLAAGIPAILSNIILGSSTDKYGRKFLFFLPCIGTFLKTVLYVLGIHLNLDLKFYLIGYFIEGLTGQMFTMLLVSFTYVADITATNGKNRSFGITLIELSLGIAVALFSFTTGYFIQAYGFFYPMLSSGVMTTGSLITVIFIPETFPKEKRNPNESILIKLKTAYDLFFGSFNRGRRWMYNILMVTFTLTMFTVFGRSSVEPLYQLGTPFCWSPEKLGYYGGLKSLLQQMIGMGMVKLMQWIMSDEAIAMFGCLSFSAAYVMEGFARTDIIMYLVPVVGAWGLLTIPMCRSIMSGLTRSDQQGAIFAAIAAMETAINLGGSVAANEIYSHTVGFYRGFVFFIFAGCCGIGFFLIWIYRIGTRRSKPLFLEIN